LAFLLLVIIGLLLKLGVSRPILYFVLGVLVWVAVLRSGIHATIAGVILGFMVPSDAVLSLKDFDEFSTDIVRRYREARAAGDDDTAKSLLGSLEQLVENTESASERLTRQLNDWVSFLVLPLFALSNAGVTFSGGAWRELLTSHITWGVLLGLVVGKPIGVLAFSWLAVRLKIAEISQRVTWLQIGAVGALAGIGFTVSIFISSLAFSEPEHLIDAKTAVLGASVIAGVLGYFALRHEVNTPLIREVATGVD
jgi:NhaA family Na+:H+ antiporter